MFATTMFALATGAKHQNGYAHRVRSTLSGKSFGRAFSKARGVKGEQPLSRSAERETPYTALLFLLAFSLAPITSREKATKNAEYASGYRQKRM